MTAAGDTRTRLDPLRALAEPAAQHDPNSWYAVLHREQPTFWYEPLKSWVLCRYDDCVAVLRDGESFSADWSRVGETVPPAGRSIQSLDPPEQTPVRRLFVEAMRGAFDDGVRQEVTQQAASRLAVLARRDSFDFVTDFAAPLALSTISRLLGVPAPDPAWFVPLADSISDGMDGHLYPEKLPTATAARTELASLTARWLADPEPGGLVGFVARRADSYGVAPAVLATTLRVALHAGYTSAARLPVATITQRRAEQLAAAPAPVRLHLDLRGHVVSGVTENILAETTGGRADRTVMAGAHLDSVTESPGINDNASSAAALLETALRLAPDGHRVRNRVRFAWWGAEELIVVGSTHYVATLTAEQRSQIALYLNWELLGSPNFGRFVVDGVGVPPGSAVVSAVISEHYADRTLAHELVPASALGSDHEPFADAGIPIGGYDGGANAVKTAEQVKLYGGEVGRLFDPCYHQPCDRLANIDMAEYDRNARAVGWEVGRFAMEVDDVLAAARTEGV